MRNAPRRVLNEAHVMIRSFRALPAALALLFLAACAGGQTAARDFGACTLAPDMALLPEAYGEVIYRHQGPGPNHLYIIGIGHRDAITHRNGRKTARVQAEVYKTAEWLVRNKHVELLVPEGFFENGAGPTCRYDPPLRRDGLKGASLKRLEKCFADERNPTHAGMLLLRNHPLRVKQIEDRALYDGALACLVRLEKNKNNPSTALPIELELKYLQERRTASMLQRIPEVVNAEFRNGNIRQKQAILMIGLNHLSEIIQYVNAKKIELCPPAPTSREQETETADLNLLREEFGITVIIPRTLARDDEVLKGTRLDFLLASRSADPIRP